MSDIMRPISEFDPETITGRILVFCPTYPEGHEMRMRILDSNFVGFGTEITHFVPVVDLEPGRPPIQTIYEQHGFRNRQDYFEYLSEEYDIDIDIIKSMAEILGPNEDFDGLVTNLEDGFN